MMDRADIITALREAYPLDFTDSCELALLSRMKELGSGVVKKEQFIKNFRLVVTQNRMGVIVTFR